VLFKPQLTGITIYPVKSLDGIAVSQASVLQQGSLANDRRWRLVDEENQVINAKRSPALHTIRAEYEFCSRDMSQSYNESSYSNFITLSVDLAAGVDGLKKSPETFPIVPGREGPCEWFSDVLHTRVFLQENTSGGFPDDCDSAGPTIISSETIFEVASWFELSIEEVRRRFRSNLELSLIADADLECGYDIVGPFWEDLLSHSAASSSVKLHTEPEVVCLEELQGGGKLILFGELAFRGTSICRRCVVPTRDSLTGVENKLFRDIFETRRGHMIRPEVNVQNWSNYFRLGVNSVVDNERSGGDRLIRVLQDARFA